MYELCFVFINCALIPFLDNALWLVAEGLATGYIDAREHPVGERHFDVDWSPIIEDLYSPELGFMDSRATVCFLFCSRFLGKPLGCRGSACVEVMPTLHGSAPSLRRRVEGCVPPEEFSSRTRGCIRGLQSRFSSDRSIDTFSLGLTSWIRVEGRLIRVSDQSDQRSDQRDMDSQIVTIDQFAEAMASIQEAIASLGRRIDGQQAQQVPPKMVPSMTIQCHHPHHPVSQPPQAMSFTLHSQTRLLRLPQSHYLGGFDGAPVTSLPAKFRMPEIEQYTGIGCPRIHLRLYTQDHQACGRGIVRRFWVIGYGFVRCRGRISRGLWTDSSPSDIKGKKPFVGSRPADVNAIGSSVRGFSGAISRSHNFPSLIRPMHLISTGHRHLVQLMIRHILRRLWLCLLCLPGIERPSVSYTATGQPCYAAQFTARPAAPYPRPRAQ
ncbi:hypothetical protein CK203_102566 [Vitis vinifera]|uniref:Uncharacterized protein n=1 Tax=Vitis vinifera TaxID=29760 RepID=A0A438D108_VITVI|nr:hypothetical protein CK203_102566 [Vitis vinifera]